MEIVSPKQSVIKTPPKVRFPATETKATGIDRHSEIDDLGLFLGGFFLLYPKKQLKKPPKQLTNSTVWAVLMFTHSEMEGITM